MKRIFIICPVTMSNPEIKKELEDYTKGLEDMGNHVHLPHRNTNQKNGLLDICLENIEAIKNAEEVHLFYMEKSKGIHFDIGVALSRHKPIKLIKDYSDVTSFGKNFLDLISEWNNRETSNSENVWGGVEMSNWDEYEI